MNRLKAIFSTKIKYQNENNNNEKNDYKNILKYTQMYICLNTNNVVYLWGGLANARWPQHTDFIYFVSRCLNKSRHTFFPFHSHFISHIDSIHCIMINIVLIWRVWLKRAYYFALYFFTYFWFIVVDVVIIIFIVLFFFPQKKLRNIHKYIKRNQIHEMCVFNKN